MPCAPDYYKKALEVLDSKKLHADIRSEIMGVRGWGVIGTTHTHVEIADEIADAVINVVYLALEKLKP